MSGLLAAPQQLDPPRVPRQAPGSGWPIIVFSSGIYGCCEMYTQFCRDLASGGAVVVAVEHEDGSGIFAADGNTGERIPYVNPPQGCNVREFRHPFLEQRVQELAAVTATLAALARGKPDPLGDPSQEAMASVLRCGDAGRVLLAGHSFGASGVARFLRRAKDSGQPCPFKGALMLDLWGAPLTEEDLMYRHKVPVVLLMSEEWQKDTGHSGGNRALASAAGDSCLAAFSCNGVKHQWISESHLLLPGRVLRRVGIMGPADHSRSYHVTARAAVLAVQALLRVPAAASHKGAGAALRAELAEIDPEVLLEFE